MNVGSTFTGIGGLDLGLERAGMRIVWQCESDAYRREVLRLRFPGVPVYEDVGALCVGEPAGGSAADGVRAPVDDRGREAGAGLPDGVDLLAGGFPCQDVSVAGRRAGLDGERSGLFFEFARIAESLRPRWLLVENVPGLLSSNGGRDFGCVLGTLADIGYGLGWRILDSRYFGVPQRRRRVFIVGALIVGDPRATAERAGQVLAVGTRCEGHSATRGEAGEGTPVASLSGLGSGGPDDNDGQGGRLVAETLTSGSHPNSNRPGRRREDDTKLVSGFHMTQDPIDEPDGTPALGRTSGGMGVCVTPNGYNGSYAYAAEANARAVLLRVREALGEETLCEWGTRIAPALQQATVLRPGVHEGGIPGEAEDGISRVDDSALSRPESPTEWAVRELRRVGERGRSSSGRRLAEQLARELAETLPVVSQPGAQAAILLRALWQASQGLGVLRQALPALQDVGRPASDQAQPALSAHVRRLTPREAERLQGFPDGWTTGPDSRRYAALGDAVTVNVAQWLGERIMAAA